jgi:hypothetical protein
MSMWRRLSGSRSRRRETGSWFSELLRGPVVKRISQALINEMIRDAMKSFRQRGWYQGRSPEERTIIEACITELIGELRRSLMQRLKVKS